jgi:hypothetical protein
VRRFGCNIFTGRNLLELRQAMFTKATAPITIGGNAKTKEAIELAEKLKISVIPVGMSGGTAQMVWLDIESFKKII